MGRTLQCPAWQYEASQMPKSNGSSSFADEGTLLHDCMEEYATKASDFEDMLDQGRKYGEQELTAELVDTKLVPALDAVLEICNNTLGIMSDKIYYHSETPHQTLIEPFVELIEDEAGGSIDFLAWSDDGKDVLVLDYKFGFNKVSPVENPQALFYALAAAVDPATSSLFEKAERLHLAIVQPTDSADEPNYSVWSTDINVLDQFELDVYEAIDKANANEGTDHQAGEYCKYCPAEATCPLKTGITKNLMLLKPEKLEDLSQILDFADEVESFIKAARKLAFEQLELGQPVEGFKLVNKRATRNWNGQDLDTVRDTVKKAKKLKLEDAFDMKLKSPAQFEKMCKSKGVDFAKYSNYISSVSSGTTLVRESDKREAAVPWNAIEILKNALPS